MQYEANEQIALFRWIAFARNEQPDLDMLYHIPNGGSRNRLEAYHLKQQGVRPGVPDLCLPVARGEFHGLYIELKYGKNKTTANQDEWIKRLQKQGYAVAICYGWEQAKEHLEKYLALNEAVDS